MIHIACASCKQSVEVEDLLSAAKQPCPSCGRFVIGGGDPKAPPPEAAPWEAGPPRGAFLRVLNFVCGDNPLGLRTAVFGERLVLDRHELSHLPDVCMRCGAPADRAVRKSFVNRRASNWSQLTNTPDTLSPGAWVREPCNQPLEPWVTFEVPLCQAHAHHFVWQNLMVYLSIVGFVGAAAGTALLPNRDLAAYVAVPLVAVSVVLAVFCIFSRGIRAGNFFDVYIEMWGVSPIFIRALAEHRTARLHKDAF